MRADSPLVLVMKNWFPYSLSSSRNTAGIFNRPFSSTFAGQLPRSFICSVRFDPGFHGIRDRNVVWKGQNAHLHHKLLKLSTLPYRPLLYSTVAHFSPLLPT